MQKEGVNPASLLQEKGATNHSEEVEELRTRARDLERELAEAQRSNPASADLREAKELAIKWHRRAETLEQESREIALAAIQSQKHAEDASKEAEAYKSRFKGSIVIALFACLVVGAMAGNSGSGSGYKRGYSVGYANGSDYVRSTQANTTPVKRVAPVAPVTPSKPEPTKAVCYSAYQTPQGKVKVRITYNKNELGFYAKKATDKRWTDISEEVYKTESKHVDYSARDFMNVVKNDAGTLDQKVNCTLGKLF